MIVQNIVRKFMTASICFCKFLQLSSMQVSSLHIFVAEGLQQ